MKTYVVIVTKDYVPCVAIAVIHPQFCERHTERNKLRGDRPVRCLERSHVKGLHTTGFQRRWHSTVRILRTYPIWSENSVGSEAHIRKQSKSKETE